MNRKQFVVSVIKQSYRRSLSPTKGDRPFLIVLYCCTGLYALVAFTFISTGSTLVAWLMYATMGLIVVAEVALIVWRVRYVARQLKEDA